MLNRISPSPIRLAKYLALSMLIASGSAYAATSPTVDIRLSVGNSYQVKNDVQIPNTALGTRFSLADNVGEGPLTAVRAQLRWQFKERHGLRLLLAPLYYTETVEFDEAVNFEGQAFAANTPLDATYKFNSWRIGYYYSMVQGDRFNLDVGGTIKIRDAEVGLEQGATASANENVGFVPLLYLAATYQLSNNWTIGADLDGLAGGPGRAIDLGLTLDYALSDSWGLGLDLRVLEGGADTDVYNFAQFNSASVALNISY